MPYSRQLGSRARGASLAGDTVVAMGGSTLTVRDASAGEARVYVERGRRRTGSGRVLYDALLARLAERGFRTAVAGMTLPNDASEALHRALGFEPIGVSRRIGWKHGAWHDVAWTQRTI